MDKNIQQDPSIYHYCNGVSRNSKSSSDKMNYEVIIGCILACECHYFDVKGSRIVSLCSVSIYVLCRDINVRRLQLSSKITFGYKFVLCPMLFLSLPFLIILHLYTSLLDRPFEINMLIQLLCIFVVFGLLVTPFLFIKKVVLLPDGFLISNYKRELHIPFDKVKSVHGSLLIGPELILLRVEKGQFGRNIIFIPKLRTLCGITINPVVKALRDYVKN